MPVVDESNRPVGVLSARGAGTLHRGAFSFRRLLSASDPEVVPLHRGRVNGRATTSQGTNDWPSTNNFARNAIIPNHPSRG
jgi:hypothetical protein